MPQTTTIFQIVEPRNFGLYPHRNRHVRDEISCSNIANYVKFLLKKVSFEKNTNSWKFFNFSIFFPKCFFFSSLPAVCRHIAGNMPAMIFQLFFREFAGILPAICRHTAGKHSFPENFLKIQKKSKLKKCFFFRKKSKFCSVRSLTHDISKLFI